MSKQGNKGRAMEYDFVNGVEKLLYNAARRVWISFEISNPSIDTCMLLPGYSCFRVELYR